MKINKNRVRTSIFNELRKWSHVKNNRKNAMTTDTSELTINVLY